MFLLVGASTRSLAESAVYSGFAVMAIDYFGDADQRLLCPTIGLKTDLGLKPSVKRLLQIAGEVSDRELQPRTLEGVIYTSGPENHPEELQLWEQRGLLVGNNTSTLRQVRDPWQLRRALRLIGALTPPFYAVEEWKPDWAAGGWIIKPIAGGGGHGIRPLERDKKGALAQLAALGDKSSFIIQKLVYGIPASATFIADGRRSFLLGTSRQLAGPAGRAAGPFTYAGNIVPLSLPANPGLALETQLAMIAGHLTATFGLRGLNTLDFIVNRDGIWILEVNPRWSASVELIEKWRRELLFPLHLAVCGKNTGESPEAGFNLPTRVIDNGSGRCFWGKAIVYARLPLQIDPKEEIEHLYRQGLRDIPVPGTIIDCGQPVCTVLARAESDYSCWRELQVRAAWARRVLGKTFPRNDHDLDHGPGYCQQLSLWGDGS
ncbi:ATP-grasp domain-containing protein [Moorella sulfitireducens]|uniref:ATP-grasp domain-containing protein n=1 Tax=Neomoorella sulfitireducens TaxID=2972948 RepID=UPI0021ABAA82|nr:ATP-grasp domain-containing protein [Moorella sulfitireducens]